MFQLLAQATTQPTIVDTTSWTPTIIGVLSVIVAVLAYIHNFLKPAIDTAIADAKSTAVEAKVTSAANAVQVAANTSAIAAVSLATPTAPPSPLPATFTTLTSSGLGAVTKILLLLIIPAMLLGANGCASAPPSTQPTPPSANERQILLAAYTAVAIAVDSGALPASDAPLATKAYNDAVAICDQWDAGTLTTAAAIADIETDLLQLTTKNQAAMQTVKAKTLKS